MSHARPALLDLLADGAHDRSRVRFLSAPGAPAEPLAGVWASSARAAGWIRKHHGAEAVIATTLEASGESLTCLVGAWRAGARLVSLPARARGQSVAAYRHQVTEALRLTGAQAMVTDPGSVQELELPVPVVAPSELVTGPAWAERSDGGSLVQFSSGTTAAPKGIVLSLEAIAVNVNAMLDRLQSPEPSVSCSWLPLSHDMGLIGMCLAPWATFGRQPRAAGEMILIPTTSFVRNPSIWMRACSEHRATATTAPTFAYDLVARRVGSQQPLDLSSMHTCGVGAEPISADVLERFCSATERFGLDPTSVRPAYGLAETTVAISIHTPGTRWDAVTAPSRPGAREEASVSSGEPLDGIEVRCDGTEDDPGSLQVRTPSLFEGYVGGPTVDRHGWFDTGDLGFMRDGRVYVTGRVDELLFVGGMKIAGGEVERVTRRVDGVRADGATAVQAAAGAYLVIVERRMGRSARAGADELARRVRAELVGAFGRGPSEVLIVPPGALPRTPSGKVQRHLLRTPGERDELEPDAQLVFRAPSQAANTEA